MIDFVRILVYYHATASTIDIEVIQSTGRRCSTNKTIIETQT